jgi:hypothetical protein
MAYSVSGMRMAYSVSGDRMEHGGPVHLEGRGSLRRAKRVNDWFPPSVMAEHAMRSEHEMRLPWEPSWD